MKVSEQLNGIQIDQKKIKWRAQWVQKNVWVSLRMGVGVLNLNVNLIPPLHTLTYLKFNGRFFVLLFMRLMGFFRDHLHNEVS